MQMTAVYCCVRILAEAIAGRPLHIYQYTETGSAKALSLPLYPLLNDEPNTEQTSFIFRDALMTRLPLWGNAYAQTIRNEKGQVIALYPLMPDKMIVNWDVSGQLYYENLTCGDDLRTECNIVVRLQPTDVLHIPGLGFDSLAGSVWIGRIGQSGISCWMTSGKANAAGRNVQPWETFS